MGRYVRHLTGWLRERGGSFDVVFVDRVSEEMIAAVDGARTAGYSVVGRVGGWGSDSDWSWWQTSRAARRCAAYGKAADSMVCKSGEDHRALLTEGYLPSRIHRIDVGFPTTARDATTRQSARANLGSIHSDLLAEPNTPIALCLAPMTRRSGLESVAHSVRDLVSRYPRLRFWLIGDGPQRDSIDEFLRGEGVRRSVAMPGSFCDVDELFQAADLYLQPGDCGLDCFLPSAVTSDLPVLAIDDEVTRAALASTRGRQADVAHDWANWFTDRTARSLRKGVAQVLEGLDDARRRATELRRCLVRARPESESLDRLLQVFERSVARRSVADSSIEAAS